MIQLVPKFKPFYFSVATILLLSSSVGAQETKTATDKETPSPSGTWKWERDGGAGKVKCELILKEKKGKVTGNYKDEQFELKVQNGKYENGKISFELTPTIQDQQLTVRFHGKVDAKTIEGTSKVEIEGEDREREWIANRSAAAQGIVGNWAARFTTPDDIEITIKFEVSKKDDKYSVKLLDDDDSKTTNVTFKDGTLVFDRDQVYAGQNVETTYELEIKDDKIKGILEYYFPDNGNEGELEVEGERVK